MRILIIGCGYIGSVLAKTIHDMPEIERIYVTDKSHECASHLARMIPKGEYIDNDFETLGRVLEDIDLVVEAASQSAAKYFIPFILEKGRDIMVMSVGAFAEDEFREEMFSLARKKRARIYVPTGAVCGTDGLRAASMGRIDEVQLITRKSPEGFRNNPYLAEKGIKVEEIHEPRVVFEGPAREAAANFPRNLNVAATVSLLGVGLDKTKVTLILDPETKRNSHTIVARGDFGELRAETQNVPSPKNPATSYLAALSAVSTIRRIVSGIWIGV